MVKNVRYAKVNSYTYIPKGVCPKLISFDIEDEKLHNIRFTGGCPGNLQMIGKLMEGSDARKAIETLKGNNCAGKGTSCADQLANAIEEALKK